MAGDTFPIVPMWMILYAWHGHGNDKLCFEPIRAKKWSNEVSCLQRCMLILDHSRGDDHADDAILSPYL